MTYSYNVIDLNNDDVDGDGYIDAGEYNTVVTEYRLVDKNNIYVW